VGITAGDSPPVHEALQSEMTSERREESLIANDERKEKFLAETAQ